MKHDYFDRDDDLAHCRVCGGAEGDLTTDCPGRKMDSASREVVYAGMIDYQGGKWVPGVMQIAAARHASGGRVEDFQHRVDSMEAMIRITHRQIILSELAENQVIAMTDLLRLDRGGLASVCNTRWDACDEGARQYLLNHGHHFVNSCARLAEQARNPA